MIHAAWAATITAACAAVFAILIAFEWYACALLAIKGDAWTASRVDDICVLPWTTVFFFGLGTGALTAVAQTPTVQERITVRTILALIVYIHQAPEFSIVISAFAPPFLTPCHLQLVHHLLLRDLCCTQEHFSVPVLGSQLALTALAFTAAATERVLQMFH